jgi:hypothetical protein
MEYDHENDDTPKCGICGSHGKLVKTECCDNWVCDDKGKHIPFSNERNSCFVNHNRFTLCAYHFAEKHKGDWQTCAECRENLKPEIYAYFGTNNYNFQKLANPPAFTPTRCTKCKRVINLGEESYTLDGNDILCEECGPQFT